MTHHAGTAGRRWAVCVFAYNEERGITACLDSVLSAGAAGSTRVYVVANGCSDGTEALVEGYAKSHPQVTLVPLRLGDKSNAWNVFVHEVAPEADVCFFVDGDVRVCEGAFERLAAALEASPGANAAAAVPARGRSKAWQEALVCEHHLILGNLYALRGEFVARARDGHVRFPIGYIGDDGLITSLAKWNLDPQGPFLEERVAPCPEAKFTFSSLSYRSLRDWKLYFRRGVRYSHRHFQHEMLVPILREFGVQGMPRSVDDLYLARSEQLASFSPRSGLDAIFDRIALKRMKALVALEGVSG